MIDIERTKEVKLDLGRLPEVAAGRKRPSLVRLREDKDNPGERGEGGERKRVEHDREEEAKEVEKRGGRDGTPRVTSRGLPCERLFLDLVELLEGLFREKSLQSLGRGSEMPRDAGSLEQAVRGHGRCRRRSHKKELRSLEEPPRAC